MLRRHSIVAIVVCLATAAASGGRADAAAVGTLTQLPGTAGCYVDPSSGIAVNGCTAVNALQSPQTVVLSPDERFARTPSNFSNAITVFARSPGGALAHLGCISSLTPGCQPAVNTALTFAVVIPRDGRSLYVTTTSPNRGGVDQFARDPASGAIGQVAASPCLGAFAPCTPTRNVRTPRGLVASPDGRFVYVAAFAGDDVAVFARDAATSMLAPVSCVRQGAANAACKGSSRNLDGATDIDLSPDGRSLYVTSYLGDAITAFARDPGSGALTQPGGENGCISQGGADGCRPSTSLSLAGARGVAVSPDGRNVYAGAFSASALSVFRRKTTTGALRQLPGKQGCVANREPRMPAGCAAGRGLHHMWGIAISRDGRSLYSGTGGDRNSGLAIFQRATVRTPAR